MFRLVGYREIVEHIKLPSPFGWIVIDEMREISNKLDTLPERIAEALRK